jgi:hypothetical protein
LPSPSHADKCDGDGNNTGNGIGNDVAGDEVGDGKGDKAIVTNTIAAIAIVLATTVTAANCIAAADTTIAQCRCPQRSHYSGCRHHPPLQHRNQMAMVWVMVTEAMATVTRVAGECVGERAKNARGKGRHNKSPCCVSWADETRGLSSEKTRQGPTPRHANTSLEGIQKQITWPNHMHKG